jgi:hypothetical protein
VGNSRPARLANANPWRFAMTNYHPTLRCCPCVKSTTFGVSPNSKRADCAISIASRTMSGATHCIKNSGSVWTRIPSQPGLKHPRMGPRARVAKSHHYSSVGIVG